MQRSKPSGTVADDDPVIQSILKLPAVPDHACSRFSPCSDVDAELLRAAVFAVYGDNLQSEFGSPLSILRACVGVAANHDRTMLNHSLCWPVGGLPNMQCLQDNIN